MAEKERKISKKARVEILLEDLTEKVDTILEGREVTDGKIDRLEQKVDANKAELEHMMKSNSKALHGRIDKVEEKIDKVDKKIDNVEVKLTEKIDKVETKLTEEIKNVEVKLGQRIDKVELRLGSVEHEVKEIKQQVAKVDTKLDTVIGRQDKQEIKLDEVYHKVFSEGAGF